jgi:DnaJ-domain-containing protein 1
MREYHPDKVAHLGEALQKVAHEKSQEIQQAYRALRR